MSKNRNRGRFKGSILLAQKLNENVQNPIVDMFSNYAIVPKGPPQDNVLLLKLGLTCSRGSSALCTITRWIRPTLHRWKLNSDGCSKGNLVPSGCRCLLRSSSGGVEWTVANWIGFQTNMKAKACVLVIGVKRCHRDGI